VTHDLFIVVASFLACAVEMVEALTIVLAVGVTRGWRSTLIGAVTALGALALVVAALGPALATTGGLPSVSSSPSPRRSSPSTRDTTCGGCCLRPSARSSR
jgi:hypothetical protein